MNDLVKELGLAQPVVSKHLAVLRGAGLVTVRKDRRQRVYQLNAEPLKAIADWIGSFEQLWSHHMTAIKAKAEAAAKHAVEAKGKSKDGAQRSIFRKMPGSPSVAAARSSCRI